MTAEDHVRISELFLEVTAMESSLPQQLVRQVGGSFKLTALLQKRVRELVRGQKPLFETRERNYIKIAAEELQRGLIQLVPEEEEPTPTL